MKIQRQLIPHDPDNGMYGDCHRTCIAVLLGIDAQEVPHFYNGPGTTEAEITRMNAERDRWLAEHRGMVEVGFAFDAALEEVMQMVKARATGVPCILGGVSSAGCNHSVVCLDGEIVCDPSGNGIVGPMTHGFYEVSFLAVKLI